MDEPRLYAGWGKNHTYVVAVGSSAAWSKVPLRVAARAATHRCSCPPARSQPFPPLSQGMPTRRESPWRHSGACRPKLPVLRCTFGRAGGGMCDVTAKYATNLTAALERRQLSEAQVARAIRRVRMMSGPKLG